MPVKIQIEYRCMTLDKQIMVAVPDAEVDINFNGRKDTFEVTINGQLIFSKLKLGAFPDITEIVEQVVNAKKNKPVKEVTGTQPNAKC